MDFDFSKLIDYLKPKTEEVRMVDPMEDRKARLLDETKLLETQGQKDPVNIIHPQGNSPLHGNSRAYGAYGLMPNTVREMAARDLKTMGPGVKTLYKASDEKIYKALKDNEPLQRYVAKKVIETALEANPDATDEQLQYLYKYGHNKKLSEKDQPKIEKDERTRRFKKLRNTLSSK